MRRRLLFPVAAMVAIGLLAAAAPASALPAGSLDPTFGWGGISVADFGDGYPECTWDHSLPICRGGEENAADVFGLADGSVLVQLAPGGDVVRFRADGQLDTTFGNGGRTSIGVGNGHLRVDGHGSIYVPWRPSPGTAPGSSAITRLRPNGTIDTTFGVGGTVLHACAAVLP